MKERERLIKRKWIWLCLLLLLLCPLFSRAEVAYEGLTFTGNEEYIDLQDHVVRDFDAFMAFLDQMPNLKQVDMWQNKMTKDQCDMLAGRYPDMKWGWTMLIRIWKQADRYTPGNGHKYWLSRIAHNMAVDYLRVNKREIPMDYTEEAGETEAFAQPVQEDIAEEVVSDMNVEQVLNLLKPAEREIVHLKVIGEQTFERIAAILQLPLGTVTWRYRQAITKLRRCGYEA